MSTPSVTSPLPWITRPSAPTTTYRTHLRSRTISSGSNVPWASDVSAPAAYLGHASIQTTFDLYGLLMPGNEDEAVALVDAYLERATTARRIAQLDQ